MTTTQQKIAYIREKKNGQSQPGKSHPNYRHGKGSSKVRDPLYQKWAGMKRRCLNKNDKAYARYGGKGITVSRDWLDFKNFERDMGPTFKKGLSLERINNSKGYSKSNCKWIPTSEQSSNRSNVKIYSFEGLKMNASQWDKKLGFKKGTVRNRIVNRGWSVKKALTTAILGYQG